MNTSRIEAVLGYALAVAAQADEWRDRELGPIHLLKYLYLADLAFAESHGGASFTGIDWRFHKFGPWSVAAYQQLEPALAQVGADRKTFSSKYQEDNVRWRLKPDQLECRDAGLPLEVVRVLNNAVGAYGSDTSALLHHVYRTPPMLRAAPGEPLSLASEEDIADVSAGESSELPEVALSKTRLKKMRSEMERRLANKRQSRRAVPPDPAPRYDEVFAAGVAWLDGPEAEPRSGTLTFSDDAWPSRARGDAELP